MAYSHSARPFSASESVEAVSGNVLGALVAFFLLQVPVLVLAMVIGILLPGLGVVAPFDAESLSIAVVLLAEAILIGSLTRVVRGNLAVPSQESSVTSSGGSEASPRMVRPLEELMLAGALIGVAASLLMGLGPSAARIALTVIEAFASLLLLVVVATRWIMSHRASPMAVVALCATLCSLWLATRTFTH
jgi:hypothetical protein